MGPAHVHNLRMSSTTQDYDATKDASSYEQRGVEKYDGAGDHDGKRWHCHVRRQAPLSLWSRVRAVSGAVDDGTSVKLETNF